MKAVIIIRIWAMILCFCLPQIKEFGEESRGPAEQHIRDDHDGYIPGDWREFDIDFDGLERTAVGRELKADLKKLYGVEI